MGGAVVGLWRNLLLPIRQLTANADALAAGRLVLGTATTGRRDEIGTLARAFARSSATISAGRADLASQVAARTQELQSERAALELALHDLQAQSAERAALQTTLTQLQHPVIPVFAGMLVMPLIGTLSADRLGPIEAALLAAVTAEQAHAVLIDVTGVPTLNQESAQGLVGIGQALRLLGARTLLVGVRPEVAEQLVYAGVDLDVIRTAPNLQRGIEIVARSLHIALPAAGARR